MFGADLVRLFRQMAEEYFKLYADRLIFHTSYFIIVCHKIDIDRVIEYNRLDCKQ
jgi:hypothetical protein